MTKCKTGKRRFNEETDAQEALKVIHKHPRERVPIRIYPCNECHGYHLTSRPKRFNGKVIKNKAFEKYLQ